MLCFWAYIEESDIESYAGTRVLPDFMSHLKLSQFSLKEQPFNKDGLGLVVLRYIGQGRVEDVTFSPFEHAMPLLRYVFPQIPDGSLKIPSCSESIWFWKPYNDPKNGSRYRMQLFFERTDTPNFGDFPPGFSPWQSFLSVSRSEIFIGNDVFREYFSQNMKSLGIASHPEQPLELKTIAGGFSFENSWLGGEYLLEKDEILFDILSFAGIRNQIEKISNGNLNSLLLSETDIDESGVTFHLDDLSL